jgi:hypothetical protein
MGLRKLGRRRIHGRLPEPARVIQRDGVASRKFLSQAQKIEAQKIDQRIARDLGNGLLSTFSTV